MSLYNVSAINFRRPHTTVVRSLGGGKSSLWPAVWPAIRAQKCVLLLETKPWFLVGVSCHLTCAIVAVVEFVWGPVVVPAFAQDNDVVAAAERIREGSNGAEVDVGVVTGRLAARRAIEIPFRKLFVAFDRATECLQARKGKNQSKQVPLFSRKMALSKMSPMK